MITHSIEETLRIADRILVLNRDKGQLVEVMERAEGPSVAEDSNLAKALAARLTAMLETAGGC
jgi:ABC-type nitrate/sulfonate/bicarbonate transport system ATPase subunit